VKLNAQFYLVQRLRMRGTELHLHSPIRLHGVVLNEAQEQLYPFAFYPCHRSMRRPRSELEGTCEYVE
jgi:hypothetical protein